MPWSHSDREEIWKTGEAMLDINVKGLLYVSKAINAQNDQK